MKRAFIPLIVLFFAAFSSFGQTPNTIRMEEMQVLDSNRVSIAEETGLYHLYMQSPKGLESSYLILESREQWDQWTEGLTWKPYLDPQKFDTHTLVLAETVFGCRSSHGVLTHLFYEADDPDTPIVVFFGRDGQVARCISTSVEAAWVPHEVGPFKVKHLEEHPGW